MKRIFLILINLLFVLDGYSQPCTCIGPDNCINAVQLTINSCISDELEKCCSLEGGEVFCTGSNISDWYYFQATNDSMYIKYTVTGGNGPAGLIGFGPFGSPTGGCVPGMGDVIKSNCNVEWEKYLIFDGNLIVGQYYLISINDETDFGLKPDIYDICLYESESPCESCVQTCGNNEVRPDPPGSFADITTKDTLIPPRKDFNQCYDFIAEDDTLNFNAGISGIGCGMSVPGADTIQYSLYDNTCTLISFCDFMPGACPDLQETGLVVGNSYTICWRYSEFNCDYIQIFVPYAVCDGLDNCSGILPIRLLYFEGKLIENNNIHLKWVTATEINNDYFMVEKSNNGFDFVNLININGSGNSTQLLNYFYIDNNPYNGINYYRLKQTDYDGQYSYSEIIAIKNIINDNIKYIYFDIYGRIMLEKWDGLPSGIYINWNGIEYKKLFKF